MNKITITDLANMYACGQSTDDLIDAVAVLRCGLPGASVAQPTSNPIACCQFQSRAGNWIEAGKWMRLILRAAGLDSQFGSAEDEGYALHCGSHPVQIARARNMKFTLHYTDAGETVSMEVSGIDAETAMADAVGQLQLSDDWSSHWHDAWVEVDGSTVAETRFRTEVCAARPEFAE